MNGIIQIVAFIVTFLLYRKIGLWLGEVFVSGSILRYIRDDWKVRLPQKWSDNRYIGLSRTAFYILCVFYFLVKEVILLLAAFSVRFYKFFLWDIWRSIFSFDKYNWYTNQKIEGLLRADLRRHYGEICLVLGLLSMCFSNYYKGTYMFYGLLTIIGIMLIAYSYENIDGYKRENGSECFVEHGNIDYNNDEKDDNSTFVISDSEINRVWYSQDENEWKKSLQGYYSVLSKKELELDLELEALDFKAVENYSVDEFYDFLYNKYFVWKYGYSRFLKTYLKNLSKYKEENRMADLEKIKNNIFNLDLCNIEKSLYNAKEIYGLGVAGASGLLSIIFPNYFGTVDQFVVKSLLKIEDLKEHDLLKKMNSESLKVSDGVILIKIMREKANILNKEFNTDFWTPRKIDMILWSIDRKR